MEDEILLLVVGVAVAGVFGQWLGWKLKLPAIIPLLLIGALLGPIGGVVKPSEALGEVMRPAIGMAVAIIVFEGGLNLNLRELRSAGSGVLSLGGRSLAAQLVVRDAGHPVARGPLVAGRNPCWRHPCRHGSDRDHAIAAPSAARAALGCLPEWEASSTIRSVRP